MIGEFHKGPTPDRHHDSELGEAVFAVMDAADFGEQEGGVAALPTPERIVVTRRLASDAGGGCGGIIATSYLCKGL